jgi:hypothetical protein
MLIPSSFLHNRIHLSWNDVLWGYNRQMLGWSAVVDLATDRLSGESNDPIEIELAGLQKSQAHQVGELLHKLSEKEEAADADLTKRKWLYLTLSWLFENKKNVTDPLGEVETIYADFDYPKELETFVRYMPVIDDYDPGQHSKAVNEERLFEHWRKYLHDAERQLGASNASA